MRKKDTKRIYAMKVLSKREIIAKKEVAHTIGERKILQRSSDCERSELGLPGAFELTHFVNSQAPSFLDSSFLSNPNRTCTS